MDFVEESLKKAITGEFNAIHKYKTFAEIAANENLPNVAYLFKALVGGEQIHLANHKRALGTDYEPVLQEFIPGTTIENLKLALRTETYEYEDFYPSLIKKIKKNKDEKGKIAKLSMSWAKNVELIHSNVLKWAIKSLEESQDFVDSTLWVCKACGSLYVGINPTKMCPVCKHDLMFYEEVEK